MKKPRDTSSPDSVKQRLRNARVPGQSVQNAQTLFVLERFLARVSASPHRDRLVLKGGILLYLLIKQWIRPTEDIDLLAVGIPGPSLAQVLSEVAALDLGDRFDFRGGEMTSEEIREDTGYPCQRFTLPYHFGEKHRSVIKLDLSFGDPVTPGPALVELVPILSDFAGGSLLGYPIETLLAEKIETTLKRGLVNTRAKDFFDLWVLSRVQEGLQLEAAATALGVTAAYRGTALHLEFEALKPGFGEDPALTRLWNAYINSKGLTAPPFPEVSAGIQAFIRPIVQGAISGTGGSARWNPGIRAWSEPKG